MYGAESYQNNENDQLQHLKQDLESRNDWLLVLDDVQNELSSELLKLVV